jgi:hypothetical protein
MRRMLYGHADITLVPITHTSYRRYGLEEIIGTCQMRNGLACLTALTIMRNRAGNVPMICRYIWHVVRLAISRRMGG